MIMIIPSKGAYFDKTGKYRYLLIRELNIEINRIVCFIMLNPSTADETEDDPTIRRCIDYTKRWGYDRLLVVNLYSFRATDPKELLNVLDPVGPLNDNHIRVAFGQSERIIAAWGSSLPLSGMKRAEEVLWIAKQMGKLIYSLRMNQDGNPAHPLYLPKELKPHLWRGL
jgi:hypothetical protein